MKPFQDILHIMDFNGNQTVQGPNESFSAASKGFQTMNKDLILDTSSHESLRKGTIFMILKLELLSYC